MGPRVRARQQARRSTASRARHRARAARWQSSHSTVNGNARRTALPHPVHRTANGPSRIGNFSAGGAGGSGGGGGSEKERAMPESVPSTAGASRAHCSASSPPRWMSGGERSWTVAPMPCVVMTTRQSAPTRLLVLSSRAIAEYCTTARPARDAEKRPKPTASTTSRHRPAPCHLNSACSSIAEQISSWPARRSAGASTSAKVDERTKQSPHNVGIRIDATCGPMEMMEKTIGDMPCARSVGSAALNACVEAWPPSPSPSTSGTRCQCVRCTGSGSASCV
eukprot:scaffold24143_cov146-Isochrysis_galbana.AAC.10